jgi:hypothetical protein
MYCASYGGGDAFCDACAGLDFRYPYRLGQQRWARSKQMRPPWCKAKSITFSFYSQPHLKFDTPALLSKMRAKRIKLLNQPLSVPTLPDNANIRKGLDKA